VENCAKIDALSSQFSVFLFRFFRFLEQRMMVSNDDNAPNYGGDTDKISDPHGQLQPFSLQKLQIPAAKEGSPALLLLPSIVSSKRAGEPQLALSKESPESGKVLPSKRLISDDCEIFLA
jgi:hypothetical protein